MTHPGKLRIEDFTYHLPDEQVAHYPLAERDASRLLLYKDGHITEDTYRHLANHIPAGATLVFNQAKVVHARLLFKKETGGNIEVFCLAPDTRYADIATAMLQKGEVMWECLVGGASKWKAGQQLQIVHTDPAFTLYAEMHSRREGSYLLQLRWTDSNMTFAEVLHHAGKVPLPPYLNRPAETQDSTTYQTVYARDEGSVAAPTAGLHFTDRVLKDLTDKQIETAFVTLHVGAGTFIPVKADTMQDHAMHAEWIEVEQAIVARLAQPATGPVIAVGTTSLRTIESIYWLGNGLLNGQEPQLHDVSVTQWQPYETAVQHPTHVAMQALLAYMQQHHMPRLVTRTRIIIAPGYTFRVASGLITNFHQPKSTLLLLVAAATGGNWQQVYDYALNNGFRFLSYGDGSLLWIPEGNRVANTMP
jgi:S-adenosylmethionine:tRNA ribosyltransferase-isomerase